jgi:ribosomal protein L37AE/L43A
VRHPVYRCSFCGDQLVESPGDGFTVWTCVGCDVRYVPGPDVEAWEQHRTKLVGEYLTVRLQGLDGRRKRR